MAGQILYLTKRYGRSRVYHPANGCYVSSDGLAGDIDDLREWQREGVAWSRPAFALAKQAALPLETGGQG
jgi:hypothetical protein